MTTGQSAGRRAFTLLELLVVIVIVAVLAALALPVLSAVRENGKNAQCVSNLRQIFGALSLYCQDHANRVAATLLRLTTRTGLPVGYSEMILPYVDPGRTPQALRPRRGKSMPVPSQAKEQLPDASRATA